MITKSRSHQFTQFVALLAGGCCLSVLLSACNKPEEKVADAREKVTSANQELKEAKREARTEWQADWVKFKAENDEDMAANERRIIVLRKELSTIDAPYRAKYTARIDELAKRNYEPRDRVNNYKDTGDEQWNIFKQDVKREMDDLKSSLKNITIKNS